MIFKERFWLRGDQSNLVTKLNFYENMLRNSDKYADYRQYKPFILDIFTLAKQVLSGEQVDIMRFATSVLKSVQKTF